MLDADEFGKVFKTAKRSRDRLFTVLYRLSSDAPPKLGLAVSKKHCRHSTGRNRIKRIIRESFRRNKDRLSGLDVVVMNTRETHTADNRMLDISLDRHWKRCSNAAPAKRQKIGDG